jgi:hypothetical protein
MRTYRTRTSFLWGHSCSVVRRWALSSTGRTAWCRVSTWAFLLAPVSVDSEAFIAHWTRRLTLAKSATGLSLLFVSGFSVGAIGLS